MGEEFLLKLDRKTWNTSSDNGWKEGIGVKMIRYVVGGKGEWRVFKLLALIFNVQCGRGGEAEKGWAWSDRKSVWLTRGSTYLTGICWLDQGKG